MESAGIFAPYIPLIDKATDLIIKIVKIYETAEYNKNICEALVNRVKLTENAIDTLQRRKQKNVDIFNDEVYYKAFNRFIYVLEEIEKFAAEISKIRGLKKYTQADFVKNKFQKLTNDYDVAMKDLHFTMAVASEEQRKIEEEALKDDLDEMSNYIKKMHNDILENNNEVNNKIDFIYDAVKHMRNHSDVSYNVNKIDSKDLISVKSTDKRGCWEIDNIKKHVIKGHRERISFEISTPENQKIKKIINDTWKQNPQERISFMKLLDMLEELHNSIRMNPTDILRDKSLDSSKYISNADADLELPDESKNELGGPLFSQIAVIQ
ncbi:hypothetical protein RhiirA4_443920 [Rhizophagus irregularis]|uniref:Uncharacterized protein n=1 Tax=Rhizophagus irregularis TaxID=588596 RepID=A0A2I1GGI6_9GLOM|nr:hypothetical protein RhiirA4_443920 [Rhizophagus irregularis]